MGRMIHLTDGLEDYLETINGEEPAALSRLRRETDALGDIARMQIGWVQARFMQFLLKALGARRYLEIGTFTGYSALAAALVLPAGGKVIALDNSEKWTAMARRHWAEAGLAAKIDLRLGNALPILDAMIRDGEAPLDMVFIDADKEGIPAYFDRALTLLRPGGIVIVDNILWSGRVADPQEQDADTRALRAFNEKSAGDTRAFSVSLPVGDGLCLAVKS